MSIEKHGNTYRADFNVRGVRHRVNLNTGHLATAIRLEREAKAAARAKAEGRVMTGAAWDSFKKAYLLWAASKNPRTVSIEERAVAYLEDYSPLNRVEDVTPALLDGLKAHLKAKGKGIAGINRCIRAVKFIMRWGERNKYSHKQEWSEVKKFREPKGRVDFYTIEELGRLFKAAARYPHHLTLARLCSRAGLRASEAYHLMVSDCDLVRKRINISAKPGFTPKNYESRFVPIPPDLISDIKKAIGRAQTPYLISEGKWRPASVESMATEYRDQVVKPAKLRGRLHILRHTYASHLAMAGIDPWRLQKLLGHSSLATTEIYAHLMPESLDATAALLPKIP